MSVDLEKVWQLGPYIKDAFEGHSLLACSAKIALPGLFSALEYLA